MPILRAGQVVHEHRCPVYDYIQVENVISVFFTDLSAGYASLGETHDFWEIIYVDKGSVSTTVDDRSFRLPAGQIYVHRPNEFHRHFCHEEAGASAIVLAFEVDRQDVDLSLCNRQVLTEALRQDLVRVVRSASGVFTSIEDDDTLWRLNFRSTVDGRQLQVFKNALELFLLNILLWGEDLRTKKSMKLAPAPGERPASLFEAVDRHFREHLDAHISLDDLCRLFGCSKTMLNNCFHKSTGTGPISYFNRVKIEKAKEILVASDITISEVAYRMGFSSPQYFARVFRKEVGIYPSEYLRSINKQRSIMFVP